MKRLLGVALSVVALLCAVAVALVLTGVWSPPWVAEAKVDADGGGVTVSQGKDVVLPSSNGSPEVQIPAAAFTGNGRLEVKPVDLPEDRHGWSIKLSGSQLTGQATLVFKNVVTEGSPPPLVGFNESPNDEVRYVLDAEAAGKDMVVRTTHFSNWFTQGWDAVMNWARGKLDRIYRDSGTGEQPKCDRESEARAGNVSVTSDSGGRVQWCLGKAQDGSTVLKVNNSRGYAVSAERTPGLTIGTRSLDFGQMVPRLAKYITAPSKRGNTIDIIGPGETVEYKVDPASGAKGVRLEPSPPAYLATALWFGIETVGMVYTKVFGKISGEAIGTAVDAANCVAGFQGMATADVTDAKAAASYLNGAMGTVMSCMGKVFMDLAKGKLLDVVAASIASVFSWVWSGIQTAASGLAAAADTALNFNGYTVVVTYPAASASTPPAASASGTKTYSGTILGAPFSFRYPADWKIEAGQGSAVKISNAGGKKMAELDILDVWDANAAIKARPVTVLPATPGESPLSKNGAFQVRNVAMDLGPYPEDLAMVHWEKPVQLSMSISQSAPSPATLFPHLLYGLAYVETGRPAYSGGDTSRLVLFESHFYFDSMEQVQKYSGTAEYRQIQSMIASFKG